MSDWKAFEDCTRKQLLTTCYALEDQRDRAIQRAERAEAGEKQALAREAESTREAYRLRDRQHDHYEAKLDRVREAGDTLDAMASGADACGNLPGYLAFRAAAKRIRSALEGELP